MRALLPLAALAALIQEPDAAALHLSFLRSYDAERLAQADSVCRAGVARFPADPRFVGCRLLLLASPLVPPDPARAWRLADSAVLLRTGADQKTYGRFEATIHVAAVLARAGLVDSARRTLSRIPDSLAVDPTHFLGYHKAFAWRMAGDTAEARRQLQRYLDAVPARRAEFAKGGGWWFRGMVPAKKINDETQSPVEAEADHFDVISRGKVVEAIRAAARRT